MLKHYYKIIINGNEKIRFNLAKNVFVPEIKGIDSAIQTCAREQHALQRRQSLD